MTYAPGVRLFNDPCVSDLTPRQRDILDRVVAGRPNKAIAYELGISQRTVENHRAAVMQTLNARCFADLMRIVLTMPQPSRHAG